MQHKKQYKTRDKTHRDCISVVGQLSVAPHSAPVLFIPPLMSPNTKPTTTVVTHVSIVLVSFLF